MTEPLPLSDENPAHAPAWRALRWAITAIAAAMSLYHMYVAGFGPPEAVIFRGIHLLFALTLVFLLFPTRASGNPAWRIVDAVLLIASWGFILHIFLNYNYFINRVKHWATEMEGFTLDLLNLLSRPAPKVGRSAKDTL